MIKWWERTRIYRRLYYDNRLNCTNEDSNDVEVKAIVIDVDSRQIEMFLLNDELVMTNEHVLYLLIEYFECFLTNPIENDTRYRSMNSMKVNYWHEKENNRWQLNHHWKQYKISADGRLSCHWPRRQKTRVRFYSFIVQKRRNTDMPNNKWSSS